jgi:tetratricopeptide (TPR) repeat protein
MSRHGSLKMEVQPTKFWPSSRRLPLFFCAAIFIICFVSVETLFAHGELLIRIADVTKKIKESTNNNALLYLERGELHREDKDWLAAASDYNRAAQLNPKLESVDFCRAKMLEDSGQLDAARKLLDKIIARSPKDGEARIVRAHVLVKLGEHHLAVADFRRGLESTIEPQPEYFLQLAQSLIILGKRDEALSALDDGNKKFGTNVMLQRYALDLELERKNFSEALARLDSIIEHEPRKETWLAQRGDILIAAGKPDEARKSFLASLKAVQALPLRIQQGPAMVNLQSRVNTALEGIQKNNGDEK